MPFFGSGLSKGGGVPTLSPGARQLFREEFRRHLPGGADDARPDRDADAVPPHLPGGAVPFPLVMATAAGIAGIVLPVLPILGTRFAVLGLLARTAV